MLKEVSFNHDQRLLDADIYQYNALSDGIKKTYTNSDELTEYGNRGILDPNDVSYFNLSINGVLQPPVNYTIQKGFLTLTTEDVPLKGSIIVITFVTFNGDNIPFSAMLNSTTSDGLLPLGDISIESLTDIDINVQDTVNPYLELDQVIICGPLYIPAGSITTWEFMLTLNNTGNIPITNITVTDSVLLDTILSIENRTPSINNNVNINNEVITWNIDVLDAGESTTASFRVKGLFNANGTRFLSSSLSTGDSTLGPITSNIVSGNQIEVSEGLNITSNITSGPTKTNSGNDNTWRIEINVSNLSNSNIFDILIVNNLFIEDINNIEVISMSHGNVNYKNNQIFWEIGCLKKCENSILVIDITGSFSLDGLRSLYTVFGVGNTNFGEIHSNISQDSQIMVFPCSYSIKEQLLLKNFVLSEEICVFTEDIKIWKFSLEVTNLTNTMLRDIIVMDYILLDEFDKICSLCIPLGDISISQNTIIWNIDELSPKETLTAIFEVRGLFNATGLRSISKAIATALRSNISIISNISSGRSINVFDKCITTLEKEQIIPAFKLWPRHKYEVLYNNSNYDIFRFQNLSNFFSLQNDVSTLSRNYDSPNMFGNLTIEKNILAGPLDVPSNSVNTWRVETKVTNNGYGPVSNIVIVDTSLLDNLVNSNVISISQGSISRQNNDIVWNAGNLNSNNTITLITEITGSFNENNAVLNAENYQYNTVSDGIKTEFTNDDELIEYGNNGIPNPNEVSFMNLYINGVLQPEANYIVDTGLLTLITEEIPNNGVPIVLEYLKIKDENNQLLKAETYQYNTLANGLDIYTNADELTMYGNRGILNPQQVSFVNLFVNGAIQPKINYIVQEGILMLKSEDMPIEGAPISIQFISLIS